MAKDIVKKETQAVTSAFAKKAHQTSQVDRADILLPKLLLMQGPSALVADELAQMGDIVNSVTSSVLGGKEKALAFIPLFHFKDLAKFEIKDGEKPKFLSLHPWTKETATWPWDEVVGGKKIKNIARLNFYVLLESEADKATALPYLLSFSSTSYQNGKKLTTHFAQADMAGLQACSMTFNLNSKKEKNDKGTYYIFDISPKSETNEKYLPKIEFWWDILAKGLYQVDETDLETEATAGAPPSSIKDAQASAQF